MTNPRWKRRPEGSTWGDFGPDDQLGRLNLVTPEKVLQGIREVQAEPLLPSARCGLRERDQFGEVA